MGQLLITVTDTEKLDVFRVILTKPGYNICSLEYYTADIVKNKKLTDKHKSCRRKWTTVLFTQGDYSVYDKLAVLWNTSQIAQCCTGQKTTTISAYDSLHYPVNFGRAMPMAMTTSHSKNDVQLPVSRSAR